MTESSVQQIQQRLTCPICLDRFKKPKLLPCQHTFCLSPCLINLVDRTTRRVKCPECRMIHNLPIQGVDAFPNNITLLRFLDLDFSSFNNRNIESMNDNNRLNQSVCAQCNRNNSNNLTKCLDCEKYICVNCKPIHLAQLKNETRQSILNLRRILPKLSQKVGNYEQRKTIVNQNFDSIKRDITSIIEKLIEDLRNRERCLHAEAEVYMQSEMRTIGLEIENSQIELASVSSFCDSTEFALNRNDQTNDNEIALMKKQCKNFLDQMNNLNEQPSQTNKIIFSIPDLTDLSNYIKNFGILTNSNREILEPNQFLPKDTSQFSNNDLYGNQSVSQNLNQTSRQRQTWNRNITALAILPSLNTEYQGGSTTSLNNIHQRNHHSSERPIMGGGGGGPVTGRSPISNPMAFSIDLDDRNNRSRSYNSQNNTNRENLNNSTQGGMVRSNTIVLERNTEPELPTTRSVDVNELYNVRRRARARTPLTFNFMLDGNSSNIDFDNSGFNASGPNDISSTSVFLDLPQNPKINYASKKRAKLIIGKQGREKGEFIWPTDVSVNNFNSQLLVSDSSNHRIQIFENDGKFVKTFGSQGSKENQFNSISCLFTDSMSNIFVVDRLNHRVQIFDRYCRFVRSIGSGQGKAPGQLNHPWGIAVNKISEIFICDKENDRISVFHLSGKFLRSFGTHGTNRGQFDKPYYIHITNDNKILVSDSCNHRIQAFDMSGVFLYMFGREGVNPGEFKHPRGITTDNEGFILVADSGNSRIQVFRADGCYVTHFGEKGTESGKFQDIEGIAVSQNGDIIVCDKDNHRVQIL